MRGALTEDSRETVVVRIFVVLNGADPAEELVGAAAVDVPDRATRLGRIIVEVPVKMDRVGSDVLQLRAGSFPQFLTPGEVPLIELLCRQIRTHGDRVHVGPGNACLGRTCAGARSRVGEG